MGKLNIYFGNEQNRLGKKKNSCKETKQSYIKSSENSTKGKNEIHQKEVAATTYDNQKENIHFFAFIQRRDVILTFSSSCAAVLAMLAKSLWFLSVESFFGGHSYLISIDSLFSFMTGLLIFQKKVEKSSNTIFKRLWFEG